MNYIKLFMLLVRFIPCVVMVFAEIEKAKQDDDEVSPIEIAQIVEKFFNCIAGKLTKNE